MSGCILHTVQALNNVFGLTKSRNFWVKALWQRLRALYGVGEAVIAVEAVLKKWTPRQVSPRNLGLAVAQLSVPIGILIAFGSPYHRRPNGSASEIRSVVSYFELRFRVPNDGTTLSLLVAAWGARGAPPACGRFGFARNTATLDVFYFDKLLCLLR